MTKARKIKFHKVCKGLEMVYERRDGQWLTTGVSISRNLLRSSEYDTWKVEYKAGWPIQGEYRQVFATLVEARAFARSLF